MGSETFSEFLIPLKFKLDEPSKKKFDAAITETEKKFAAIGAAAGAAAVALGFAVKEISKNLAQLAYAAERVGATSEEFKALGNAAERIGVGADAAKSSLSAFFAFVNFEGGASAIKQWFNIDFDPMHPLKAMLDSAVKLADEYALGGAKRQTAIVEARRAGINETLLTTPGAARRLRDEMEKDEAFTGGKLNPIAEKAKRLNAEFEKFSQRLKTISEFISGSLMDAFSDLLEKTDGWLKAHRDDIIWFSNQAAELAKNIFDATKGEFRLLARLEANTAELMRTQDVIKTIREALKWLGESDIASKINAALEWAFQPFKWLWDKLQSLGLVGPSGTAGGAGYGPGSGRGGETSLDGAEGDRGARGSRGRASRQRGAVGGGDRGGAGSGLTQQNKGKALHMMQRLIEKHGFTEEAAASAVGQVLTERPDFYTGDKGPKDHGSEGLFQWRLDRLTAGKAWAKAQGRNWDDIDTQTDYFAIGPDPGRGVDMEKWKKVRSIEEGNRFGQQFERYAGGLQHRRARDAEKVKHAYDELRKSGPLVPGGKESTGQSVIHGQTDPHKPGFDPLSVPFHHSSLFPLGHQNFASNEHHDHRALNQNVEIKVAGGYQIDKTEHPMGRSKNATLIRNTTATAA